MIFKELWTNGALKDLSDLDKKISDRITRKVQNFCESNDPFLFAKSLSGSLKGLYRFRIGDYRVIFRKDIDDTIIIMFILRVKHRKEVYE